MTSVFSSSKIVTATPTSFETPLDYQRSAIECALEIKGLEW